MTFIPIPDAFLCICAYKGYAHIRAPRGTVSVGVGLERVRARTVRRICMKKYTPEGVYSAYLYKYMEEEEEEEEERERERDFFVFNDTIECTWREYISTYTYIYSRHHPLGSEIHVSDTRRRIHVSYEDELTYILDIDVYVRACVRARASVFCQNSGFKTRNYVDLYCEHYGDCANSE